MDSDPCGNDNFYDENASFLPQLDDYSLEDLDEILRVTNSHLDSSLNFSSLDVESAGYVSGSGQNVPQPQPVVSVQANGCDFNVSFDYPPPIAASPSAITTTPPQQSPQYDSSESQRTSSVSSADGEEHSMHEHMINFFNVDDDVKMEEYNSDAAVLNILPQRNTPSPTGSCSSSGGSSTSGVQSDISSVASMPQTPRCSELSAYFMEQHDLNSIENGNGMHDCSNAGVGAGVASALADETKIFNISPAITTTTPLTAATAVSVLATTAAAATTTATTVPITVPVLPIQSPTTATILQPVNVVQGAIIPIKTVPLVNVKTTVSAPVAATNVKIEPKLAPKIVTTATQPLKLISTTTSTATTANTTNAKTPTNAKPKTIYLSSNDFKALMQKMNTNGTAGNKSLKPGGGGGGGGGAGTAAGQLPKIIMKTPNGKVITANKIIHPFSANNNIPHNLMSKIVKSNAPLVIKQQQQQQHHNQQQQHHAKLNFSHLAGCRADAGAKLNDSDNISVYKGTIDEKMVKKQQRMIKNRESASLSRKKKKEYVVSLETRINNLEKENYTLKGENTSLRSQLVAFAQTCQCKHGNVSEFILNSLNASNKVNQPSIFSGGCTSEHQHVKIAPKPSPKSLKQRMSAANVRKNMAVLFAMAFMVTLNVGNFQTYFNNNAIENALETAAASAAAETEPIAAGGRRLLWVESESEFKEKLNRTKLMNELEVPPLHFLRPINRTSQVGGGSGGVDAVEQLRNGTAREPPPLTKCADGIGVAANQTENMRLVNNLQKWIDGNGYLNFSSHEKFGNDLDSNVGFKLSPDYVEWKSRKIPVTGQPKRKYFLDAPHYDNKLRKLDTINADTANGKRNQRSEEEDSSDSEGHSLELFKPKLSDEYIRLFKGIKRQDDTFYVLSFNMEHILLPASNYNKSARPKMSLMLPAGDPSLNGDIVLMQIDCEVVNTTEIKLKSEMIPEKLRPSLKYKNVNLNHPTTTTTATAEPNPNDVANNETRQQKSTVAKNIAVPIAALPLSSTSSSSAMANITTDETKPAAAVAKSYIIMGPNNTQAAATALGLKKKPTIVKLTGSHRVPNIVALNMRNSTLFTKMRETVEIDATAP